MTVSVVSSQAAELWDEHYAFAQRAAVCTFAGLNSGLAHSDWSVLSARMQELLTEAINGMPFHSNAKGLCGAPVLDCTPPSPVKRTRRILAIDQSKRRSALPNLSCAGGGIAAAGTPASASLRVSGSELLGVEP